MGASVGSFLNVVIYRVPRKLSFVKGRSHCTDCNAQLEFRDMIPVVSWFVLKGRCRNCGSRISPRYPIVEAIGGIMAVLAVLSYGFSVRSLIAFYVLAVLIAVAFTDIDTKTIPNGYVIALLIAGVVLLLVSDMIGDNVPWYARIIGFFAISLPMYVIVLIKNNAFGGGDIKLMAACGLILGWKNLLCGFFFGVLCAGVYAIIALVKKDAGMKSEFAFGPYLSLGIAAALLYGTQIVSWYTSLFAF